MPRTYAKEVKHGKMVKIAGWVQDVRSLGSLVFVIVRDHTGLVQVTAKKDNKFFQTLSKLRKESVISVEGRATQNVKANKIEIIPDNVIVLSSAEPLPIDLHKDIDTGLDKRLDARCVDLRKPENHAIFIIQSVLLNEMQSYLDKQGFIQVFTPCLMGTASESGSEVFTVNYYDRKAFLRQDPQLHRQLAIASGFEKIYDIGPSWRAELSHTTRHLTEHRVVAAELAFIDDEYDVMTLQGQMVIHALNAVKKHCKEQFKHFDVKMLIPKKVPLIEFPEIYEILESMGHKVKEGEEYGTEGERLLGQYAKKNFKSDLLFVNKFPYAEKPFYVMKYEDGKFARSTDLLVKGVEMSSGGQREHRFEQIMQQAKEKGIKPESVSWFADFFKYGVPPHGGFAIGIERLTMVLLEIKNVRECVLFPRDVERLTP